MFLWYVCPEATSVYLHNGGSTGMIVQRQRHDDDKYYAGNITSLHAMKQRRSATSRTYALPDASKKSFKEECWKI